MEAADDICYAIIDIEDGYALNYLSFKEAQDILKPIAGKVTKLSNESEMVAKLRAVAIGNLVNEAAKTFLENESGILSGKFTSDLISKTKFSENIALAKETAKRKIYWSERKTKIEIAGDEIIQGLLKLFVPIVKEMHKKKWDAQKLTGRSEKLMRLIPCSFEGAADTYQALLRVTDFIAGMTDRYALDLYRKLKGISI